MAFLNFRKDAVRRKLAERVEMEEFEAFLSRIQEKNREAFPNTAVRQIPKVLSKGTKRKLMEAGEEAAGKVLAEAVNEINGGSTAALEKLVCERL